MTQVGTKIRFGEDFLSEFRALKEGGGKPSAQHKSDGASDSGKSFMDHLKEGVTEVDGMQKTADTMAMEMASGKQANLHETMLAATQAELGFNLMVQIRNKVLEAYQEIMRMQV